MYTVVHSTGTLSPNQTQRVFASGFERRLHIIWTVVPTTPSGNLSNPQLDWDVAVTHNPGTAQVANYIVSVRNLTAASVSFELRYAVLN
jgi:hypothetical protein